jgi:hypothetical protein
MPRVSPRHTGSIFDWTGAPTIALREAWAEGLSCSAIAAKLTARFQAPITKNMVVGRVNRLALKVRGHAVTGEAKARAPRLRRAKAEIVIEASTGQGIAPRVIRTLAPVTDAPPPAPVLVAPQPHAPGTGCKFPLWGKGRPDHRYCDAPRHDAGAYCATHHRLCYLTAAQHRAEQARAASDMRFGLSRQRA